ncbi:MAG: PD40 domain-containing protein [Gemmatimonadaceae bacterium]|nr:PD40 domain-containing protein [Gemmatimonadaceae bacterium]
MRRTLLMFACLAGVRVHAQVPDTDVYVARLSRRGDSLVAGPAINVTMRAGYDNQPAFLPDSRRLLYTSIGADAQADIWEYDLATRRRRRLTTTPESEYSATVIPAGASAALRFSAVRVERDSAQRLWSFDAMGGDPRLILKDLKPVGYHAWVDSARLIAFVLGTPSTLHLIRADGTDDDIRARDIGRSIQWSAVRRAFSYTVRDSARARWIVSQQLATSVERRVAPASADNEFHAWMPDGTLLTSIADTLVRRVERRAGGAWIAVADLRMNRVKHVSRIAVSANGRWLAFVAEPVVPAVPKDTARQRAR